jgi:hypothetical protein
MIKKADNRKREIDTTGVEGNAFSLLAYANNFGRQMKFSEEKRERIQEEMKAGDYENLLVTFDKYFGEVVDLIT